jgi:hypothetical protein
MKTDLIPGGDLISRVAILQHQVARDTEQREREARETEQRARVDHLRDSAALARKGAVWGLVSGILSGAATMASGLLQLKAATANDVGKAKCLEALSKVVEANGRVDWAGYMQRATEAEKQESDLAAELAGDRAQRCADAADEAKRQAEAVSGQLEKACETRHRAAMAAQRV